ncbi:MAG TPA: methyltransferase domain-containing protein [Stellaceae bacterium]|nr:methyltransferase domain-containing protein [Stellaceae bacterium]
MAAVPMLRYTVFDRPADAFAGWQVPAEPIDNAAIAAITDLYREIMPEGGAILDLASSWICHLPPEIPYHRVVGLGVDACALTENPFLDEWRVQDLNRDPVLPFASGEFDGATICGAIQNLTRPGEVLREVARVLRPGAPLVVTFSQRCLATRALPCWCLLDEAGQLCLVARHFVEAGNWADIRCIDRTPPGGGRPLYAVIGTSLGAHPISNGD